MTDLHLHSLYSFDSKESPIKYAQAAVLSGDYTLGFSEHYEYNMRKYEPDFVLPDMPAYLSDVKKLRKAFPQLKILAGLELGYSVKSEPIYKKLLAEHDFDHAVMSVHTVTGRGDCYYKEYYDGLTKRDAYAAYLQELLSSVCADVDFQIVGHIGYVTRYAPYTDKRLAYSDFPDLFDKILKTVISRNLCLEINTGGRADGSITDRSVLARYIELGGKDFTFGSDAHTADKYGIGAEYVKKFLSSVGIDHTVRFEHRSKIIEPFDK